MKKVQTISKTKEGFVLHLASTELNDSWLSSLRLRKQVESSGNQEAEEEFERRDENPMVYLSNEEMIELTK